MRIIVVILIAFGIEFFGFLLIRDFKKEVSKRKDSKDANISDRLLNGLNLVFGLIVIIVGIAFPIFFYRNN